MKTKIAIWVTGEIGLGLLTASLIYGIAYLAPVAIFPALIGCMLTAVAGAAELKEGENH